MIVYHTWQGIAKHQADGDASTIQAGQLKGSFRLSTALEADEANRVDPHVLAHEVIGIGIEENLISLRHLLQSPGNIDAIAQGSIVHQLRRAHVTDDGFAGTDADPKTQVQLLG